MDLEKKIEGLLFYKGEGMSFDKLAEFFSVSVEDISKAVEKLSVDLAERGVSIVVHNTEVMMTVSGALSEMIESIRKDEVSKDLSKASMETLSIILYKNSSKSGSRDGVTRSEIDYIRGVNSGFILRNLMVRGLIQKESDKNDSRRLIYRPTIDLLSFMGVSRIEDLPNYAEVLKSLEDTLNNQENE
jgi:segregation and condensation protein B